MVKGRCRERKRNGMSAIEPNRYASRFVEHVGVRLLGVSPKDVREVLAQHGGDGGPASPRTAPPPGEPAGSSHVHASPGSTGRPVSASALLANSDTGLQRLSSAERFNAGSEKRSCKLSHRCDDFLRCPAVAPLPLLPLPLCPLPSSGACVSSPSRAQAAQALERDLHASRRGEQRFGVLLLHRADRPKWASCPASGE